MTEQTKVFVERLSRLVGLSEDVQDFNAPCRELRRQNVSIPDRRDTDPPNLSIESADIKAECKRLRPCPAVGWGIATSTRNLGFLYRKDLVAQFAFPQRPVITYNVNAAL